MVSLALTPLMILGGVIGSKLEQQSMGNEKGEINTIKESQEVDRNIKATPEMVANDAINNYRTVSSFGINQLIIDEYMSL